MIDPYRLGRMSRPGAMAKEKTKLWAFAILFVVVLGSFLGLQIWGNTEAEKAAADQDPDIGPGGVIDVAASEDAEGRPLFENVPRTPREERDLTADRLHGKLAEFAQEGLLADSKPEDSPEVLTYLLDAVMWDPKVTRVSSFLYQRLAEEEALFEPAPLRGGFTSAFGRVVEVYPPVPFADQVKSVDELYTVLFETAEGTFYRVTGWEAIDRKPGDWIQVYGIYYRNWPIEGDADRAAALVLTKKVETAYPPITVTEIDPEWVSEVRESKFEEANDIDERPLWLIMNFVKNLGFEGYSELREEPGFSINAMGRMARELSRLPEQYRFEYVSARGKIISPYVDFLQTDNAGKIDRVDTAILLQPTRYFVRLVSPRPWSDYDFRMGIDYVQVEGIFYKRWKYVPQRGGPAHEIPLVIVTGVYPVGSEPGPIMRALPWVFGVFAAGLVALFLGMALRDRKQVKEFRARYAKGRRVKLDKSEDVADPADGESPEAPPDEEKKEAGE